MNGAPRGPVGGQYDRDRIGQWNQSVVSAQDSGLGAATRGRGQALPLHHLASSGYLRQPSAAGQLPQAPQGRVPQRAPPPQRAAAGRRGGPLNPQQHPPQPQNVRQPQKGHARPARVPHYQQRGVQQAVPQEYLDSWGRPITRATFRPPGREGTPAYSQMIQNIRADPGEDEIGGIHRLRHMEPQADEPAGPRGVRFQEEPDGNGDASAEVHQAEDVARLRVRSRDHSLDDALLKWNKFILIFSFGGLGTMTVSSIVTWYTNPDRVSGLDGIPAPSYLDLEPSATGERICNVLGIATTVTTLITMACITKYYSLLLRQKRKEWCQRLIPWQQVPTLPKEVEQSYSFWQSSLSYRWFTEMFIHFVHPMPFMDGTSVYLTIRQKTVYSWLQLYMLARFYLVLRYWHTVSPAYVNRSDILFDNCELQRMNFHMTWTFTMKLYLTSWSNTMQCMIILMGILFFIFGFALFIIERVEQPITFGQLDVVLFYCFTTATTIGYGRVTPLSKMGRIVTFVLGCYGQILLTLFTAIITNLLEPSKEEELIQNYVRATSAEHYYRVACAMLIQSAWKSSAKYKVCRGEITGAEKDRLDILWRKLKLAKQGDDGADRYGSMRGPSKADAILAGDDVSLPSGSHSPRSRSRSLNDGSSSVGTSEQKERNKSKQATEDKDLLQRAARFGQDKEEMKWTKRNINTVLTIDPNNYGGGGGVGDRSLFHTVKHKKQANWVKSPYQRDMDIVMRLNSTAREQAQSSVDIRGKNGSGVLQHLFMMGTTRQDMPLHDKPTYRKRQESKWPFIIAPNHKSNFLFESLKRFKRAKRNLQGCQLEAKDGVLERELDEISNVSITLDDHVASHMADMNLMDDRVLVQLRAVKSAIQRANLR